MDYRHEGENFSRDRILDSVDGSSDNADLYSDLNFWSQQLSLEITFKLHCEFIWLTNPNVKRR